MGYFSIGERRKDWVMKINTPWYYYRNMWRRQTDNYVSYISYSHSYNSAMHVLGCNFYNASIRHHVEVALSRKDGFGVV